MQKSGGKVFIFLIKNSEDTAQTTDGLQAATRAVSVAAHVPGRFASVVAPAATTSNRLNREKPSR